MASKLSKIVNDLNGPGCPGPSQMSSAKRATSQRNRVLDTAARARRNKQQLAQLERDNFHDDPHANLVMHKKAPKFDDTINHNHNSSRKSHMHLFKSKALHLPALIEEDLKLNALVNYTNAVVPSPSSVLVDKLSKPLDFGEPDDLDSSDSTQHSEAEESSTGPCGDQPAEKRMLMVVHKRHFCCVCGFQAPYTCITCGMRYCCVACLQTHKDTRCLKWTA